MTTHYLINEACPVQLKVPSEISLLAEFQRNEFPVCITADHLDHVEVSPKALENSDLILKGQTNLLDFALGTYEGHF